jgi:Rps23 Pro-64 3,4-dihydroxylase Tpa1-like proline 4-hydroxylase
MIAFDIINKELTMNTLHYNVNGIELSFELIKDGCYLMHVNNYGDIYSITSKLDMNVNIFKSVASSFGGKIIDNQLFFEDDIDKIDSFIVTLKLIDKDYVEE